MQVVLWEGFINLGAEVFHGGQEGAGISLASPDTADEGAGGDGALAMAHEEGEDGGFFGA